MMLNSHRTLAAAALFGALLPKFTIADDAPIIDGLSILTMTITNTFVTTAIATETYHATHLMTITPSAPNGPIQPTSPSPQSPHTELVVDVNTVVMTATHTATGTATYQVTTYIEPTYTNPTSSASPPPPPPPPPAPSIATGSSPPVTEPVLVLCWGVENQDAPPKEIFFCKGDTIEEQVQTCETLVVKRLCSLAWENQINACVNRLGPVVNSVVRGEQTRVMSHDWDFMLQAELERGGNCLARFRQ